MRQLFQPESGLLTVKYQPDTTSEILENPPRFTWMPAAQEDLKYILQVSREENFQEGKTMTWFPIHYNFFTPDRVLEEGVYYWRYALLGEGGQPASDWSTVRSFTLSPELPQTPLPERSARFAESSESHPRLWMNKEEIKEFRNKIGEDHHYAGWQKFYDQCVEPWLTNSIPSEPAPYPENKKVISLWRKAYTDCQEVLTAIRSLSIAGVILEEESLIQRAKAFLLEVAGWNTEGTTARDYNDESAFRIAGAMAWGYDWLYDSLNEEERGLVLKPLLRRTQQVADHIMINSRIHYSLYDSHAVRSLSSVLTPCCIAMLGENEEASRWLHYTVEYFSCLYTPWGGKDGGWSEGGSYWTTAMAFVTEALNLLRKFAGFDLYGRPFFKKTGDFILYCYSHDTARASYCDQSNLGEKPALKTAYNIRQFAGITGNGLYQWYYEQVKNRTPQDDGSFFNKGWWNYSFDDMVFRHDFGEVQPVVPEKGMTAKWFRDIGWVALHHRMDSEDEHVMLLTKSSPYGSVSHSHGDQNSIVIHAYGEPLAIESGYYYGFGSTIHKKWRKQTLSQNNILIDGAGQYGGDDKRLQLAAKGFVEEVKQNETFCYVRENATQAYLENVPYLKNYTREIYFVEGSYFILVDSVDLEREGRVDWLMHSLQKMELEQEKFVICGEKAELYGSFVYNSAGGMDIGQHDEFTDVNPADYEGQPLQWHMKATTAPALRHKIVTLLVPVKKGESRYVSPIIDDQGHDVSIYFIDNGHTFRLNFSKAGFEF